MIWQIRAYVRLLCRVVLRKYNQIYFLNSKCRAKIINYNTVVFNQIKRYYSIWKIIFLIILYEVFKKKKEVCFGSVWVVAWSGELFKVWVFPPQECKNDRNTIHRLLIKRGWIRFWCKYFFTICIPSIYHNINMHTFELFNDAWVSY